MSKTIEFSDLTVLYPYRYFNFFFLKLFLFYALKYLKIFTILLLYLLDIFKVI